MKPKTGDIYCVWVEPLRKYAACQVTMLKEPDSGKGGGWPPYWNWTGPATKKRYKKETSTGLNLSITKPRKPEWLAENVDNPFRDWDGRDHIAPAHAKKAMNQYKKTLAAIAAAEARLGNGITAAEAEAELEAAVAEYTAAFNAMDKRTGFIETIEREEIFVVLEELLQGAQSRLSAAGVEIDTAKLFSMFDQIRDF